MSYSIRLVAQAARCEHCGRAFLNVPGPDPTYNLSPIFDLALAGEDFPNKQVTEAQVVLLHAQTDRPRGLRLLDGKVARDTIETLKEAVDRLADEALRPKFVALEPSNGWGTLKGAAEVVAELEGLAEEYPDHVWEIR